MRPSKKNSGKPKCTRYKPLTGSFTEAGQAGANNFRFSGRLKGKALKPARYRLVAAAADAAGNVSPRVRAKFKILAG